MNLAEIIADTRKPTVCVAPRLKNVDETGCLEKPTQFAVDGRVFYETSMGHMCWLGLLDVIHHRGQLTVYIRPMGGKVPAIYGPSADDGVDIHQPLFGM